MRLIGVLALAAPVALGLLLVAAPDALASWLDPGSRSILAALVAGIVGVWLTAILVGGYFRYRFVVLSRAAERIAAGDYTTTVPVRGRGLEARLASAINGTAVALHGTQQNATDDRLPRRAHRPSPPA